MMKKPLSSLALHLTLGYLATVGVILTLSHLSEWALRNSTWPFGLSLYLPPVDGFFLALSITLTSLAISEWLLHFHPRFLHENTWLALFCIFMMGYAFIYFLDSFEPKKHPYHTKVWLNSLIVFSIYLARFQHCLRDRTIFYQWLLGTAFLCPGVIHVLDELNEWIALTPGDRLAEWLSLYLMPLFFVIPGLFSSKQSAIPSLGGVLLSLIGWFAFANRSFMTKIASGFEGSPFFWATFMEEKILFFGAILFFYPLAVTMATFLCVWIPSRIHSIPTTPKKSGSLESGE